MHISEEDPKIKELDTHIMKFVDEMDEAQCYESKEMAESAIQCLQWSRKLFCGKELDFSKYLDKKHKKKLEADLASGKYYVISSMLIPKDIEKFKDFVKLSEFNIDSISK